MSKRTEPGPVPRDRARCVVGHGRRAPCFDARMGELLLVRHGETAWSKSGQHTGRTDLPLTAYGERQAAALAPVLARRTLVAAFSSPLVRAWRTAELAGMSPRLDQDLVEWDNGEYESLTTLQIRARRTGWWLWADGAPGGEDAEQVGERCARTIARVAPLLEQGDVALFGHGHSLCALAAVWVGLPAHRGGILKMDAASLGALGAYHDHRVITSWNDVTAYPAEHQP